MTPSSTPAHVNIWLRVFLPFALGYFLSFAYRTINSVIYPHLVSAVNLSAADLGLLTSAYFLTFAAFQIPLGILLDRFGARRIEAALLVVAGAGALLFGLSTAREGLILGRALIGLGVSACLMAAFKAISLWFSRERLPAVNGMVLASGGLGALAATSPTEAALSIIDWRGLFLGLSALSLAIAAVIFFVVPERAGPPAAGNLRDQLREARRIFLSPRFWRLAPLTMLTQGTFLAIQSLWAGPWLRDVAGLGRADVANHLLFTALGMVAGYFILGNLAYRLHRHGIRPIVLAQSGMFIAMLVLAALAMGYTGATHFLWFLFGFFGTAGTLTYSILSQTFPIELAGRVNTALNLLVFVCAFIAQWAIGAVINLWPVVNGSYSLQGYRASFGLFLALQVVAFAWVLWAGRNKDKT